MSYYLVVLSLICLICFPSACKEKLFFENNCVDTSSPSVKRARITITSKGTEALCTTEIKANGRHRVKKGKKERNLSSAKSSGLRGSPSVHPASVCNSSLSCSQNAIAFSQQQMIDTERLATKLLKELHSMKEIVVDTLHSESRTCTTSRNNTDKVNGLIYVYPLCKQCLIFFCPILSLFFSFMGLFCLVC